MQRHIKIFGLAFLMSSGLSAVSSDYMVSAGFGLSVGALDRTHFLVSSRLEYVKTPRLYLGPLLQLAIAESNVFGVSMSARYMVGNHAKIRPSFEGGIGLAYTTETLADSSVGILLHAGMGVDYQFDPNFSMGTFFRVNMAPPFDFFFLSWPLVVARYSL